MEILILFSFVISFILTLLILPLWIKKSKQEGFVWEDMNKLGAPKVAGSGGIVVIVAFVIGVLYYLAIRTFFSRDVAVNLEIFALLTSVLIFTVVGLVDDLWGWKNGGLSKRSRLVMAVLASIPLIVINAGVSIMNIPILGAVDFGVLYPLLIIPIGIVGAATTYNFLAGFNGLEASQGIIILSAMAIVTYLTGSVWLSVIAMIMVFGLIAFYFFNKYPAKVFPGDSLTWSIGALIAIMAILGNVEKIAFFFFIPYGIEAVLKLKGKLEKHSFGKPLRDGSLDLKYKEVYGLTHLAIRILKGIKPNKKVYEKEVVYLINGFQIVIVIIGFLAFM